MREVILGLLQGNGTSSVINQTQNIVLEMKSYIVKKKLLKSNLCDISDANVVLVRGNITAGAYSVTHKAIKNCVPFTKCIAKIDETMISEIDDLDLVMPMHNLIEYIFNYSDTTGSL